ncbi:MAG: flavin reductase family protein [Sphingomicrobium sp.]
MANPNPSESTLLEIDPTQFRSVLGHYPTGVCVVTGKPDGDRAAGLVIGTFTSVSLDPPLVGFFAGKWSTSWPRMRTSGRFCVNVLGSDQLELARRFSTPGEDKFEGISHSTSRHGLPILDGAVAAIECEVADERDAGDHLMVLGRVIALDILRTTDPLLHFRGEYGTFKPLR